MGRLGKQKKDDTSSKTTEVVTQLMGKDDVRHSFSWRHCAIWCKLWLKILTLWASP